MTTGLHANLDNVEIHKPWRQEFANAAARTGDATAYTSADIEKVAIQLDTNQMYRLSSIGPTVWTLISPDTAGEDNTASNVNVGGVGVFKQKTGVDLEFFGINAASSKVSVAADGPNNEIDIDVVEANIVHQNLSGAGTNTHAQIDTHIADVTNPHAVTKSQVGLSSVTNDAQMKRADGDMNSFASKATPVGADVIIIEDSAATFAKKKILVSSLPDDGENNTASNVNVGGVGVFKQKTGVNLEFFGINAASSKVSVAADGPNNEIDIDVVEANIVHQNLSGAGTNTHAQIDTHIADTANPHSVTKSQVGLSAVTNDAQLKRAANDISTFTEKVTPVAADLLLIEDSAAAGVKKRVQIGNLPGGGGGTIQLSWKFSTTTTAADPGSTRFRYNSATPASVTEIYVDDIALSGVDAGFILGNLNVGDEVYIQQIDDSTRFLLAKIVTVADNTGWWTLTVTIDDSGTLPANNADGGFILFFNTTGAASNQATVQARRTTDLLFTTAWVDVTFDATDVENNAAIVEHDNTNTDRLTLKETGPYWIEYKVDADVDPLSAGSHAFVEARVRVNDTGVDLPGSLCGDDALQDGSLLGDATCSAVLIGGFPYEATANDFISLQIQRTDSDAGIIVDAAANRTSLKATRMTGEKGGVGPGGATLRIPQTYAIAGEIKVPVSQVDFIPPFYVSLAPGQTAKLVKARHRINAGTSATVKLQKNGVDITGFTGISVTTTDTDTDPTDVTLADNDKIALVVTAVAGTPQNMSFTLFLEVTG